MTKNNSIEAQNQEVACCSSKTQERNYESIWDEVFHRASVCTLEKFKWTKMNKIESILCWVFIAVSTSILNGYFNNTFKWDEIWHIPLEMAVPTIIFVLFFFIKFSCTMPNEIYNEYKRKKEGIKAAEKFYELDEKYRKLELENSQSNHHHESYRRVGLWPGSSFYQEVDELLKSCKVFSTIDIKRLTDTNYLNKRYADDLNNEHPTPLGLARYLYLVELFGQFGTLSQN